MAGAPLVIAAGICAALHVAKLPPAIPALQAALGLSLLQAGFLLSAVQAAGMLAGVAFGALADGIGHRRSMLIGLTLLAAASAAGGAASQGALLLALRAVEGSGFLLVVLAAPALLRSIVAPARLPRAIGFWGAYVPIATALAFLGGPLVIAVSGWRIWWWALAALTAAMAVWLAWRLPAPPRARGPATEGLLERLSVTLRAPGPWSVALAFGCYSAQWLAVIGFLPTLYAAAGWSPLAVALASAAVAGANALGNIAAGQLLQRGVAPGVLLNTGCLTMAAGALVAFAEAGGQPLPAAWRVAAVLAFSCVGGLIPATLFTLAVRLAPGTGSVGTTVGWLQQLSASGQFVGPPLVAWVASLHGSWGRTGWVTATLAALAMLLTQWVLRIEARRVARTAL